jgi:hypothetical protein
MEVTHTGEGDNKIYVVTYSTESSDEGVVGYFTKKPTDKQLRAWFKKNFPDEFAEGSELVYWDLHELKEMKL